MRQLALVNSGTGGSTGSLSTGSAPGLALLNGMNTFM